MQFPDSYKVIQKLDDLYLPWHQQLFEFFSKLLKLNGGSVIISGISPLGTLKQNASFQ